MKRTAKSCRRIIGLSLLCIVVVCTAVHAQKINEDSLKKVIKETKEDTTRINVLRKLASYYLLHEMKEKEGLALLDQSEQEARKINFYAGICNAMLTRGNYAANNNEWGKALDLFKQMLVESVKIGDTTIRKKTEMSALGNIANIYNTNGDYATAIEYYLKSLAIMESMDFNPTAYCILNYNIASMYQQTEQYEKAEKYLLKMYPVMGKARPDLACDYWIEQQAIAKYKNDTAALISNIDSLESILQKDMLSKKQQMDYTSKLYEMKADNAASINKDYAASINYYERTLAINKALNDLPQQYATEKNIADNYFKLGNNARSAAMLEETYANSIKDSVKQIAFESAKLLSQVYAKMNDKANAYKYLSKAYDLNEAITSEKRLAQLNFIEANFQDAKKEKEIAILKVSNTENELAVAKRNQLLLAGGISAAAIMLLLGMLYRNSNHRKTIAEKEQKLQQEQIKFLERQQQVVSLQSMVNGQETERTRIAKDLHDGLGGLFSTVKMYFSTLEHQQEQLKDNDLFKRSYEMVDTAASEVRRIAHNMMPEVLLKLGLANALKDLCDNMSAGRLLQVSLQVNGMEKRLSPSTEIMLYRIVQELLNNIVKHAQATKAIVQFIQDNDRLSVTVEDDGRGFNTADADAVNKAGIETVRSRVNYLNGNMQIDSQKDVGTTVMMDFLVAL